MYQQSRPFLLPATTTWAALCVDVGKWASADTGMADWRGEGGGERGEERGERGGGGRGGGRGRGD